MASMSKKAEKGSVGSKWAKFKRYLPLYLMFLPGAIYLFINNYLPMTGIVVAFKNYNARKGIWGSPWAGLKNFEFLFASPDAWIITRNTILYNVVFIILNTVLGIAFAIFICDALSKRMGNQFISYVWNDGSKTPDYWEQLAHHNDWAQYSPAFGFMWDSSNYSTQIAACSNALNQYRPALETGSVGVDGVEATLQALNDALYASGLEDIMTEKQAQLDAWLEANGGPTETPAENLETIATVDHGVLTGNE